MWGGVSVVGLGGRHGGPEVPGAALGARFCLAQLVQEA